MRPGLRESLRVHHASEADGYPKGSIVLCQACWKPLYKLERGIGVGERLGRSVSAYRPLTVADFAALAERAGRDTMLPPGLAGLWRSWTAEQWAALAAKVPELHTGMPALCPHCNKNFLYARAVEAGEVLDRAYVVEPLIIRPEAPVPVPAVRAWVTG